MTTIYSTSASTPAPGSTPAATSSGKEFNNFLKLLTAQVRNQDPLSPMDSTQFVQQLATFSTLEQQVKSNLTLERIAGLISQLGAQGPETQQVALPPGAWLAYSGEAVRFVVDNLEGADALVLNARDAAGRLIWSEALPATAGPHAWSGEMSDGTVAAKGMLVALEIDMIRNGTVLRTIIPRII